MSTFQMLRLSSFVDSWDKQAVPSADFDTHMIHTYIYILKNIYYIISYIVIYFVLYIILLYIYV